MKSTLALVAVVTLSGAVFAQAPPEAPPQSSPTPAAGTMQAAGPDLGESAAGEVIYSRYCAVCHGRGLKGDGPVAPGLVRKPTDLTVMAEKNGGVFPYDKVAKSIDGRETSRTHGTPDMPVWGEVFGLTTGTGAPNTVAAVKRITHYVWAHQTKK